MDYPRNFDEFFAYYDLENLKPKFVRNGYSSIYKLTLVMIIDLREMGIFDAEDQQDFLDAISDYEMMKYRNTRDAGLDCHLVDTPLIELLSSLHSPLSPGMEELQQSYGCTARKKLVFANNFCEKLRSSKKRKPDDQQMIAYNESSSSENFHTSLFPTFSDMKVLDDDKDDEETDLALDFTIQQMKEYRKI